MTVFRVSHELPAARWRTPNTALGLWDQQQKHGYTSPRLTPPTP